MADSGGYLSHHGSLRHSHSTPLTPGSSSGVGIVGSDSARTPPQTPKKGGKILAVRVQMLDDSITMFQVQAKALGRLLFDQVCRQLNLLESDYFGLEYTDPNSGARYWLDLEKPLGRQVGLSLCDALLRFCTKFYTPDPAHLEEEFTRYLLCLQVKRDLAQGLLQCNDNTAALMASYIVQSECGDYVVEDYPDHTYLSSYKFVPHQDSELERRIMENHKKHAGQSPAEADLNLLETARRCELYGVKMHPAKDHEGVPLNLAVAHMGIVVFQNYTKINTFSWAKIRKLSFKRKRFLIKLHPEGYGYYKDTVEFFFEGRNECKNFWKKCVEHHGFFRCSSVKTMPRHKARVISRGSSFRYSGRTQKQIVEFVRENYVKRQTFQRSAMLPRSQSFRHSRCVHSSVASVGTSISAHPLLPLGDNAVAGTPASLSCGSVTLDDPGSPGGRYPGSAPCTSPAHTMDHHHHHHTHHSHQGLSGIGRPTSRQDTLSPATSVASSPSPPPGQINQNKEGNGVGVSRAAPVSHLNGGRHSESCSNLPSRASEPQLSSIKQPQYSSSYPEQGNSSHDDISHDSYDLLNERSDEDGPFKQPHRSVGRTRSDPSRQEKSGESNQLRMAKSEPSHSLDRDDATDDEVNSGRFRFNTRQDGDEPFYANQIIEKRLREGEHRFCSHCRGDLEQPLAGTKFANVRSEPLLCPGTSRMYSDDDSSDQYVDAQVERIPSDPDQGGDEIPSSCSSPEIFELESSQRSPNVYQTGNRFPPNRLPSPTDKTVFYFPGPNERISSPNRQETRFFAQDQIPPYSPRQPLMPETPIKSPQSKFFSQETRTLKSPPPPKQSGSPRQMLSPRQLLSPRAESSPRSPTRKFFPPEGIKSPTSPRQSLFPPQDSDPSPVRSPPPLLSPKILTHQASIDIQDDCEMLDFEQSDVMTDSPVRGLDIDYVLHKRHLQQSDSGSGSESSSDHRSRRAAPRRRALNHSGQGGGRAPVPLFARGSLEQRRQQHRNRGGTKALDVVALHRLPPTNAFSCTDDTVDASKDADSVNDLEKRRADIHGLKMAFLLSGVEEEPKTIDSSRVVISDEDVSSVTASKSYDYGDQGESSENDVPYIEHNLREIDDEDFGYANVVVEMNDVEELAEEEEEEEEEQIEEEDEAFRTPSPNLDDHENNLEEETLEKQEEEEEEDAVECAENRDEVQSPESGGFEDQPPRRPSLSRMKSMSEESDDTETARTVVTPRHTANRKTSLCQTASISEDSDACLGSDSGRKNKMASDDSDFEGKPTENTSNIEVSNEITSAAVDLSRTLEERRRALMASSEDDSDHLPGPVSIDSSRVTLDEEIKKAPKAPNLSEETRQDSVSELEKALIRALMRNSSTDDEGLSRQTSIDKVIMETTDPTELEKILIRAIMRSTSLEENPSRQASIERPPTNTGPETSDPSELEKVLIKALMRNSSTEDENSSCCSKQVSIDASRITVETQPPLIKTDDCKAIEDPVELEKALIRALMRNSSTDDEAYSRQASIDSTRVNVETQQSTVQQALELEKVLLQAIMKSSSEDEPPKTAAQQNELERFLLQSLVKSSSDEDLVFTNDKRRASCPMTKVEKSAAEFEDNETTSKPRRASEGGKYQTTEFHNDDFKPRKTNDSLYHSTHDLTKKPTPLALELFESRRRETPLRRCSYPPSSSEDDEPILKPRQTKSSYVASSSEEENLNPRASVSKTSLSDHALSRRSHIEGLRRALLDSSGSSSLEDDNPVFLPSEPPIQGGIGPSAVLLEYAVSAAFPPARTLSRISERSTTSEQDRSSEEESKVSSPSSDSEATNSEISSAAGRGENSLSSDPSSSDQKLVADSTTKKHKTHAATEKQRRVSSKPPIIILQEEPKVEPKSVTASTYIAPSASNSSYLETFYLEVRPEQASPVTLPQDSSSTDDNQHTLQDSPSSSSSRYDIMADQACQPDFFTPITCTPPSSPPVTPTPEQNSPPVAHSPLPSPPPHEEPTILSPDLPLPPPPPESSRPCSLDESGWGDELPPPPPDFTSVSPVMLEEEVFIQPPEIRRRPFIDPPYEYDYASSHTLPRRHRPEGQSSDSLPTTSACSHTLPRRHARKNVQEVASSSFQGQRVVIPIKPTVSGHHTFPRQRKHRSSHNREQQSSNTLPRARHRVAVSFEVRRGRVISTDRPCVVAPKPTHTSRHSDV